MYLGSWRIPAFYRVLGWIFGVVVTGFAQEQPADFFVGPTTLVKGECYDAWVTPSAPGMHLDIQYTLNGGPLQTILDWPVMDQTGFARNICTGGSVPGEYVFVNVRNSLSTNWVYVGKSLTVLPQPSALSFDAPSGYAGIDHYVITVTGGESMNVRVRYRWNGYDNLTGVIATDASGRYDSGLFDHYVSVGSYVITGIQNAAAQFGNWVDVNVPYSILPPQPTSFYLDKSVILDAGVNGEQTYRMLAGNGADIPIDFRYTIDNGPMQEIDYWPWLNRDSWSSWNGHSEDINAGTCTMPGLYRFSAVRNSFNTAWVPLYPPAELTVVGPGAPAVSSVSPQMANAGQSLTVTIRGQKFCSVTLTTNYPGLSVGVTGSSETQVYGAFYISPSSPAGNALVTLHTHSGDTNFYFAISRNDMGAPAVTSVTPSSAAPGSAATVTITGANLVAPALATAWPGLAFSNIVPDIHGTSMTVTFLVSPSSPPGNPAISITTLGGTAVTQLFWVGAPILPTLSREYIYLGDRVLAVESP